MPTLRMMLDEYWQGGTGFDSGYTVLAESLFVPVLQVHRIVCHAARSVWRGERYAANTEFVFYPDILPRVW